MCDCGNLCVRAHVCLCCLFFPKYKSPVCFQTNHRHVFFFNLVGPELFLSRDMKEHTRFLPFLFSFVNALTERTMNFKSAISINCHLN